MASELHERMLAIAGGRTYRAIADLTATNAETVRRYLQGQSPSVEFLASLCAAFGVNGEWLLCGRGPMRADQVKMQALKDASGPELLGAMAAAVEKLSERVERLEVYVQTLEARVRGHGMMTDRAARTKHEPAAPSESTGDETEPTDERPTIATAQARKRARRVADAVAERSRADAR